MDYFTVYFFSTIYNKHFIKINALQLQEVFKPIRIVTDNCSEKIIICKIITS